MSICLAKLLTAEAQMRLLTYCKDYLIDKVECAPLMYKVVIWLAMINSVDTTPKLCVTTFTRWGRLQALSVATLTR
jgi:hypothetical protein